MHTTLISAAQLQLLLRGDQPWLLFDCSFELVDPSAGRAQYLQQHIPGATHADLNQDLSGHDPATNASGGRHPLPERTRFAAWLRQQGLSAATQVVTYDRQGMSQCGRLWWMLKWCGFDAVAVLDGGLPAWIESGGATASGPPEREPTPGDFRVGEPMAVARSTREVASSLGSLQMTLLDARATPRFRGDAETIDPVAGHIPGALNRPYADNLGPNGRFKPAEQLRHEFDTLLAGRDPRSVVHHCGSGVSAMPNLIAMELAGLGRSALYPGSWSEWCRTPGLPIARS
jgi:thiosulfate/3-mercaptopyruvate sulfurtransferase